MATRGNTVRHRRRLGYEALEKRQMLAVFAPELTDDGSPGSLREAIGIANSNGEADEIHLAPGVYRLDLLADGDIDIVERGLSTRIIGASRGTTVLDASGLGDRAFDISEEAVLEMEGVTIIAGQVSGDGAGIRNAGTLVLSDVEIAGGKARSGSDDRRDGGAIYNTGDANLDNVRLVGNSAERGGALANEFGAHLIGRELSVLSNTAFWCEGSRKNLNTACGAGGGVMNLGHIELTNASFVSNRSDNYGGAIENHGYFKLTQATLVDNSALVGSAIHSDRTRPSLGSVPGETILDDVALSDNTSPFNRNAIETEHATLNATNVVEGNEAIVSLADETPFRVLEDSIDNEFSLDLLELSDPIVSAISRDHAGAVIVDGQLQYSPQPDFWGLDVVVLVDANGFPHVIDIWVESQNDPIVAEFPASFQLFTWEQEYLDPPFSHVPKNAPETPLRVLENASYAPDIAERLTITSATTSGSGTVTIRDNNELEDRDPEDLPSIRPVIIYTVPAGFSGVETITYTVSDGNGATLEGTIEAHVVERNDVLRFWIEARNSAGEVVDRVQRGDVIDVFVHVASQMDETAIASVFAKIRYHPSQVERVGDVQFGGALPDLLWWGDTKKSATPDLRELGIRANAGFSLYSDPRDELMLAHFPVEVVGSGLVELGFDGKDSSAKLYDLWPTWTVPFAAIDFQGLTLTVLESRHNSEMPGDVNGDQLVVPQDVLIIVNELNRGGSRLLSEAAEGEAADDAWMYYDVNNDGHLSPADALQVINVLNAQTSTAEGESADLTSGVVFDDNLMPDDVAASYESLAEPSTEVPSPRAEALTEWGRPVGGVLDVLALRKENAKVENKGVPLLSLDEAIKEFADGEHLDGLEDDTLALLGIRP